MANTMTAKQLAAWMRENNGNYKPLEASIHIILNKYGITKRKAVFNGRSVVVYDSQNAKRTLTQHIPELKYEDEKQYVNKLKKGKTEKTPSKIVTKKKKIMPPYLSLDGNTLFEGRRIFITESQFMHLLKEGLKETLE